MAVKKVWGQVSFYDKGSPSFCEHAGQWLQVNLADIYEPALMTGAIGRANFINMAQTLIPSFYRIPDPVNCLIPAFDIGRTQPHTYLDDWFYSPPDIWVQVPPVSEADAQVLFCGAFVPDLEWRLESKFTLADNEPFAFALVLTPAVRDNLTFPFVRVTFGDGEWSIYFRPEVEPQLIFRNSKVFNIGHVFGEIWHSSPIWRFEGAVGSILVLPVRGHLVVGNARQWQPLNPNTFAVNPYILGKSTDEPILRSGRIIVEGRGAACFFAFPSVDFSMDGWIILPRMTLYNSDAHIAAVTVFKYLSRHDPVTVINLPTRPRNSKVKPRLRVYGVQRRGETELMLKPVKIDEWSAHPDEELPSEQELPAPKELKSFAYALIYRNEDARSFFELVSVALETKPLVKPYRKPLVTVPLNLSGRDFAVKAINIDVSEDGGVEALIDIAATHPHAKMPVISTDFYCEITLNYENLKGKRGSLTVRGFVEEVQQNMQAGAYGAWQYHIRIKGVTKRLQALVGDGMFPPFDGYFISEICDFLLKKAGLEGTWLKFQGNDLQLTPQLLWEQPTPEELPPTLMPEPPYAGFPYWWVIERPRFTLRTGQSALEFLKELCRMTGNDFYEDLDGIWVVPTATEAQLPLLTLADANQFANRTALRNEFLGLNGGYLIERVELRSQTAWLPTSFVAVGKNVFGAPIYLTLEDARMISDPRSAYFRGFRAAKTVADDKLTSYFLLYRAALAEFLKTYARPPFELRTTLTDIPVPLPMLRSRIRVLTTATAIQEVIRENLVGVTQQDVWTVRRYRLNFSADIGKCNMELILTPPAYIPTGVILPR